MKKIVFAALVLSSATLAARDYIAGDIYIRDTSRQINRHACYLSEQRIDSEAMVFKGYCSAWQLTGERILKGGTALFYDERREKLAAACFIESFSSSARWFALTLDCGVPGDFVFQNGFE